MVYRINLGSFLIIIVGISYIQALITPVYFFGAINLGGGMKEVKVILFEDDWFTLKLRPLRSMYQCVMLLFPFQ